MHQIIFLLIGIVLITSNCGSGNGNSDPTADTLAVSEPDSTIPGSNTRNDKYIFGFTGSFAYVDNIPLAAGLSSTNDSAIERTFAAIWSNVIGGRPDAIRIEKDADQNNTEYKYAAAKGSFTYLGNIVRRVFYKSNDLSPLLSRDNGWCLRAIALHEFAHHINGDPFTGASRDLAELLTSALQTAIQHGLDASNDVYQTSFHIKSIKNGGPVLQQGRSWALSSKI